MITYDEAMIGSDSPTNLAWLINQNSPESRVDNMESRKREATSRRRFHRDDHQHGVAGPDALERPMEMHPRGGRIFVRETAAAG